MVGGIVMTQEDKILLIKDLSSRLPYAVHVQHTSGFSGTLYNISMHHKYDKNDNIYDIICYTDFFGDGDSITIEHFKPYLFPLSSMTDAEQEELKQEHSKDEMLYIECLEREAKGDNSMRGKVITHYAMDWCNKNHFDYRGLIEKGLAIDATELNIY